MHRFPGGFRNVTCSSHVCLEQPIHSTARGFREIYENFNAFCKRQSKLVKLYQINWTKKSADQCILYKYDLVFKTKTYLDISWDSPFSRLRTHESFCAFRNIQREKQVAFSCLGVFETSVLSWRCLPTISQGLLRSSPTRPPPSLRPNVSHAPPYRFGWRPNTILPAISRLYQMLSFTILLGLVGACPKQYVMDFLFAEARTEKICEMISFLAPGNGKILSVMFLTSASSHILVRC